MQTSEDLNQFLARHSVFIRKARDVSRQSLFFLCVLTKRNYPPTDTKLETFAAFVLVKIRAFVNGVHIQQEYFSRRDQTGHPEHIQRILNHFNYWQTQIRDTVNKMESLKLSDVPDLKAKFATFLHDSQEPDLTGKFLYHWIPVVLGVLKRHLFLIIGAILVALTLSSVDAVKNLLLNEGWGVLLPVLGILFTFTLVVSLYFYWPLLGVGKDSFWSLKTVSPAFGVRRWPKENKDVQNLIFDELVLSALLVVGVLVVYGAFLFVLSTLEFELIGKTSLTVYAFFALASIFLVFCNLVDAWDFFDPRPIRLTAIVLGVLFLIFSLGSDYGRTAAFVILVLLTIINVRALMRSPKERKHQFLAFAFAISIILFVVGSFTNRSEVWHDAAKQPVPVRIPDAAWPYDVSGTATEPVVVMAASGGGSRAAIYTAFTLQKLHAEFPHIASKLQAISSVSGGSLANAAYIARRYRRFKAIPGPKKLDLLAEDVHQDFLWPALTGSLLPLHSRGNSIEKEWRYGPVGLGDVSISQISEGWMSAIGKGLKNPPFPLPIFNSCSLDGHDVVISPLPKQSYLWGEFYQEQAPWVNSSSKSNDGHWTWVYYRDAIYGLEDILPKFDPQLSPAVRASANFPFGFPLVRVETDAPLRFNPLPEKRIECRKIVKLTDGGVLSNSGMWPLFNLLMQKADALKKRGVLLIVVEASKMPEYRDNRRSITSLYGTIGDRNPLGQALHHRMYDILAREYGNRLAVVQIDIMPLDKFNVFTTWALDKRSYERLRNAFDDCWKREKMTINDKWQYIQQEDNPTPRYIPATLRPPLS